MKAFIIILCLLVISSSAFSSNIYVAPVKGSGSVPQEQLDTLRDLIQAEVQNTEHRLVNQLDKAEFYLQTKLIQFQSYTLSMSRWKGNKKVSTGQWKAKDLAELEGLVQQAVSEVINTEKTSGPGRVLFDNKKSLGERAQEKKKKANFERVEAKQQVLIGFGPAYFSNMNSPGTALGFQAGFIWNIDDHIDLGLQSDFSISLDHADAHMFMGKIVANYFFAPADISPFIGAGFGYGFSSLHDSGSQFSDDNAAGFGVSLQAGLKFFRTSTVNLGLSGEYSTVFGENSLGMPSTFLVRVGLFY